MMISFQPDRKAAHLGVQTSPENCELAIHKQASHWAPTRAKSYTIAQRWNTNTQNGAIVDHVTGYASIIVYYFSTKKEGTHELDRSAKANESRLYR